MAAILQTEGLTKRFGAVTAADDINVSIEPDTVVGLIGGNGAGKTTFINMVTGYLKPDAGTIRYAGSVITQLVPRSVTQLGICRSFQIPQLFDSLTVRDNLLAALGVVVLGGKHWASGATLASDRVEAAADEALARFGLDDYRDILSGVLPEGIRKLLDIAMAMVVKPRILLLDEPTSGVSADEKFVIMDAVMAAVRANRVTILFVEHDMDIVRRYTERILAFYEGRIIADDTPDTVLDDDEVRKYVTGTTHARVTSRAASDAAH